MTIFMDMNMNSVKFLILSRNKTESTLTLIPEGYTGTIKIWFNQENGIEEKYEEKKEYMIFQKTEF